jgi:hypothetical protein
VLFPHHNLYSMPCASSCPLFNLLPPAQHIITDIGLVLFTCFTAVNHHKYTTKKPPFGGGLDLWGFILKNRRKYLNDFCIVRTFFSYK